MPLVVLCGFLCSGKSTRAEELAGHFRERTDRKVEVVRGPETDRDSVYADSRLERDARSSLKSSVQRCLTADNVTIVDSLTYIKGFRYELYCVAKAIPTPHCVLFCDTSPQKAAEWNEERDASQRYSPETLKALVMRFECPNSQNRWDSPLFVIQTEDVLPCQQISDALFQRKAPSPNMSTQSQPLSSTNFLYELDLTTRDIVNTIMEAQKSGIAGDTVSIPGTTDKINLNRHITMAELQRHRRQFITFSKLHPVADTAKITNMFVQYLNTYLS